MDEQQYRSAYREMNPTRCYFEKTLLLRYANCKQANKLFLAEREAFGCQSAEAQTQCLNLLLLLRDNARFSLQLPNIEGQLPHAKEIKVQVGGVFGIQQLLNDKNLSVAKVKEEIGELIEAVDQDSNKIHEAADVIYHLMVYLEANNIKIENVMSELKKRQK